MDGSWCTVPRYRVLWTQGTNADEALANAREAIELYLEVAR